MKQLEIRSCGVVTFFTPRECQQATLAARLRQDGLEGWIPAPRTERSALECALWDYAKAVCPTGKEAEVYPHRQPGQNGLEVVWVQRGDTQNQYDHHISAKVDSDIVCITSGWAPVADLQAAYNKHRATATSAAVGQCLVKLATHLCRGLCLRPSGGLYWIPDDRVSAWESASNAVEGATKSEVTTARWEAKASTIARVRQAIIETVQRDSALLLEELTDGQVHKDEWYDARATTARELMERVVSTEASLEESLDACRAMLETVKGAFTMCQMAAMPF